MEEDEQARRRELQKRVGDALKRAQLEERKKEIVKRLLEPAAFERLMNIRASNREMYSQLVDMMISLAQQNRLGGKVTEAQLKSILGRLTERKEPTIEFRHK
jgi:programmed cell death protein 5